MLSASLNTRRWPRHRVDLPVRIFIPNGRLTSTVAGRATEVSGSGMALHSTLGLKPGDLVQVEFPTSNPSGVMAVVRNHEDDRFGLEFLSQLPSRDKTLNKSNQTCDPKTLLAGLRRKQLEIMQVQKEIEALNLAILLLADDKTECAESSLPHRSELDRRPWPSPGPKRAQQKPLSL
jgi:hypothetical protein